MPNTLTKAENFDGRILGYTRIQCETHGSAQTNGVISIVGSTWTQLVTVVDSAKLSITFIAPPSGKVGIELSCVIKNTSDILFLSWSTSYSSYSADVTGGAIHEYSDGLLSMDESDKHPIVVNWSIAGLAPGDRYTYYLWGRNYGGISTTEIWHGAHYHHSIAWNHPPILIKAIALPATIVTAE